MTGNTQLIEVSSSPFAASDDGGATRRVRMFFRWVVRLIVLASLFCTGYWLLSSDRYVSESIVLIQNTEKIGMPSLDLTSMLGGIGGANRPDQLLLREHLLSVDMLRKLDASLDLRGHYSDTKQDFASRMWFKDASIEWFHRHYLSRVAVEFDDYAGVLRIKAQGYAPATAQAIARMLVEEGERYMNEISHNLARAQVTFLDVQVALAQEQVLLASKILLDFQNQKGLASPQATVENINSIIGSLEGKRTEFQTQLASLPRSLDRNHPNIIMLRQSLQAVERQIAQEKAKLASTTGKPLNSLVEEQQRLQMDVNFKTDVYKTALVALERGRMDASRTIKQVSVLQMPMLPEYAMEPRRMYGVLATLCITLLVLGVIKLLESVVLDHID